MENLVNLKRGCALKGANGETLNVNLLLNAARRDIMKQRIYYVYEWFKKETGDVFYVGKGKGNRYKSLANRNPYFMNVYNKYETDVRVVKDNMTEKESLEFEYELIKKYRDEHGEGYLTNLTSGMDGYIGFTRTELSKEKIRGENNPMFGRSWWDENTPQEKINEWKSKLGKQGEDNPMYGISPKERMSNEVYEQWLKKQRENKMGENNPNFGNKKLSQLYINNKELAKQKQSRPASQNGRAKKCSMYDMEGNLIKEFSYIGECSEYMIKNGLTKGKSINSVSCLISKSMRSEKPYRNYKFK